MKKYLSLLIISILLTGSLGFSINQTKVTGKIIRAREGFISEGTSQLDTIETDSLNFISGSPVSIGGEAVIYGDVTPYQLINHSQITITADYTASTREYIFCNATSNVIVVTLPAQAEKLQYTIKKTDDSENSVTISGDASETIDSELTQTLTTVNRVMTIVSDGTEWQSI